VIDRLEGELGGDDDFMPIIDTSDFDYLKVKKKT
jgi:hypothetical protein